MRLCGRTRPFADDIKPRRCIQKVLSDRGQQGIRFQSDRRKIAIGAEYAALGNDRGLPDCADARNDDIIFFWFVTRASCLEISLRNKSAVVEVDAPLFDIFRGQMRNTRSRSLRWVVIAVRYQ